MSSLYWDKVSPDPKAPLCRVDPSRYDRTATDFFKKKKSAKRRKELGINEFR